MVIGLTPRTPRVLVVTPTYDEAENVHRHIEHVLARSLQPDVLIVDDASPDGTGELVRQMVAERRGRVSLLQRSGRLGLGSAYVAGFRWALDRRRWDVVVQMDVDGSHEPASIDGLVAATARADLVLGSRYVPGGRVVDWPLRRRLLSRGGNAYARAVLRLPVHDLTGGFKAWRTDLLDRLSLESMTTEGYGFQIETTAQAVRTGAVVVEVPITFPDRQVGQSKMNAGIAAEAIGAVWRIRARAAEPAASTEHDREPSGMS